MATESIDIPTVPATRGQRGRAERTLDARLFQRLYATGGKRILDLMGASAGLLLLAPLLGLIVLLIKLSSPGRVLFRQPRVGQGGRPFFLWKFRTMREGTEASGPRLTGCDDPRLTPVGRFLRRFKLDELPQCANVLRGEMSLVGPRPELPAYVAHYTPAQRAVLCIRPGLTGPASLAYRKQEKLLACRVDWNEFYLREVLPKKLVLNLAYLEEMSFLVDLKLILRTAFWVVADPVVEALTDWLSRGSTRRLLQRPSDGLVAGLGFFLAYQIRFEGDLEPFFLHQFWFLVPAVMVGRVLMNEAWGIYQLIWRYVSVREAVRIVAASASFSFVLLGLRLGLPETATVFRAPLGVIAIEFLLGTGGALGIRVARRLIHEHGRAGSGPKARRKIVLLGAGPAGAQVAKELSQVPGCDVVGFLDDDRGKWGMLVSGARVWGSLDELPTFVQRNHIEDVILCVGAEREEVRRRVHRLTAPLPVRLHQAPDVKDLLQGKNGLSGLRPIAAEDLLRRQTLDVRAALEQVTPSYRHRRILITGAGGSIGSELSRQLLSLQPTQLLLLEKDENSLFELQGELSSRPHRVEIVQLVRDIRHREGLERVFTCYRPEIILHAAAHKHVPLMEANPAEAVRNNVFGTLNLVELAAAYGAERFLLISTDKAVNPASVMGASKRLAELIVQSYSWRSRRRGCCVRFGNVMESRGSVIPLFKRQIVAGGPVTITHPEVIRYFMTIPEAVALILQAGALAERGAIYCLDMGDPRRVIELAHELIKLSGLRPETDIRLMVTGLRPGEKLREELCGPGERLNPTGFDRIHVIEMPDAPVTQKTSWLERLRIPCLRDDNEAVRALLEEIGLLHSVVVTDAHVS